MIKTITYPSNVQATLSIVDVNGIDFVEDFIGNTGAFGNGEFTHDETTDVYRCSDDTYEWWVKVLSDHQALEYRIADLKEIYGSDEVGAALDGVGDNDLEDVAAYINRALDEAFGDDAGK